uniref:DNA-binding protein inhibitor ID-4 n=1 Tax=Equus asinus TaxID=9793 RepID=A0A9L0KFK2_EQUAS
MKAVSPVRPSGRKAPSGCGGGELALRCLAEHGHSLGGSAAAAAAAAAARCKAAEAAADEPALCLQCDMNDCYSRLRRLVPTIPPNKKVSKVEILQHVIDYILDLQLALETHPALLRQPPPPAPPHHPAGTCPSAPPRTPLTALNTDPVRGRVPGRGGCCRSPGGRWREGGTRALPFFGAGTAENDSTPLLLLWAPGAVSSWLRAASTGPGERVGRDWGCAHPGLSSPGCGRVWGEGPPERQAGVGASVSENESRTATIAMFAPANLSPGVPLLFQAGAVNKQGDSILCR